MAQNERMSTLLDLRGLDLTTPVDLLVDGRTPFAKNFRLYAQQTDDRRVAVSSRKGPGFYITPLSELSAMSNSSTDGASTVKVGVDSDIQMFQLTSSSAERLTRMDLNVSNTEGGSGPLLVQVYSDDNNLPGKLLTESSILGGSIGETPAVLTARFVNAIKLTNGVKYWIVIRIQDDGEGTYNLVTSTTGIKAYKASGGLTSGTLQTYSILYNLYTAGDFKDKGAYRFARDNGQNVTVVVYGTTLFKVDESTHQLEPIATGLSSSATEYSFTNGDNKLFWVNGYDQLKTWDGTTVATITDTELPILSDIEFHKDRLFGVVAADKNKIVFSEAPGNPSSLPTNQQWYYAWLSVSYWYIPRPHNGSPITGLVSFQDGLTILTQDSKYVLSGYDRGSFSLRQSTGVRGALSKRGITSDENRIYFVSDDGLYEHNGSEDKKLSELVNPMFDGCPNKFDITPVIWKNEVRWYMASEGSSVNDTCLIYNKDLKEFEYDTDTYVNRAVWYGDADDEQELVEFSSMAPVAYLAEQAYHSLGAPIDFEYRMKYDSMKTPAQRKRIRKFFPLIQGVDNTFPLTVGMDRDFENEPRTKDVLLEVNGSMLGDFNLDDGTLLGGFTTFKMHRLSFSGYGHYWQPRIIRKGVNNRVAFVGAQFSFKTKRL